MAWARSWVRSRPRRYRSPRPRIVSTASSEASLSRASLSWSAIERVLRAPLLEVVLLGAQEVGELALELGAVSGKEDPVGRVAGVEVDAVPVADPVRVLGDDPSLLGGGQRGPPCRVLGGRPGPVRGRQQAETPGRVTDGGGIGERGRGAVGERAAEDPAQDRDEVGIDVGGAPDRRPDAVGALVDESLALAPGDLFVVLGGEAHQRPSRVGHRSRRRDPQPVCRGERLGLADRLLDAEHPVRGVGHRPMGGGDLGRDELQGVGEGAEGASRRRGGGARPRPGRPHLRELVGARHEPLPGRAQPGLRPVERRRPPEAHLRPAEAHRGRCGAARKASRAAPSAAAYLVAAASRSAA